MVDESWILPAVSQIVPIVRHEVAELARRVGMTEAEVAGVKLAITEATANAVVHAYCDRDEPGDVAVEVHAEDSMLEVAVRDWGRGMASHPDSPGLGLGLPVIGRIAQRFEVKAAEPGTRLCMRFGLGSSQAA